MKPIPEYILKAGAEMLAPFCPGLTPDGLRTAVQRSSLRAALTTAEAAQHASVTLRTIQAWVEDGRLIPCGRRGHSKLYRVEDVDAAANRT